LGGKERENVTGLTEEFVRVVRSKLGRLGHSSPSGPTLRAIVHTAYLATLRTEEGRFIRGSLTFADPSNPEPEPPLRRRAQYPAFTAFERPVPLSVEAVVKLSRAIDAWAGSIAIHGRSASGLYAWGVVDQIAQRNIWLYKEKESGFEHPGILTIAMDGVGALSAYHGDLFLVGLRQDVLVLREEPVLRSATVTRFILRALRPIAARIHEVITPHPDRTAVENSLLEEWATTVSRICIGLRRAASGGVLLITPRPRVDLLDVTNALPYSRLGHAMILRVLDQLHRRATSTALRNAMRTEAVARRLIYVDSFAETDEIDREQELTGAVRIATTLASIDGLVLLTPLLEVVGFGVKILGGSSAERIYAGRDSAKRRTPTALVDVSHFGTRHTSMFRYCRADPRAIGIIVSQDGAVRVVATDRRRLTLWQNVQLLRYFDDIDDYVTHLRRKRRARRGNREELSLGYSATPKTLASLMCATTPDETRSGRPTSA
jgi:hypothetical protein